MHIAEFSVKNWQFMLVMFIAVVGLGVNSLLNMPRGEDPEFQAPSFSLVIVYPGTNPADMEELVVDPVEKRLNELENVKNIFSSIDDGLAVVTIEYKYEADPDEKYQEIVREVNALKTILPQDIFDINIIKFSPTDVSILQTALVSESASYKTLGNYADKLKERLEKIKSLKNVDDWGYPEQTVRISLNIEKMAQEGIPINRVVQALQSENLNIPAGSVNMNTRKFNVKTSGDYSSIDEMRTTIVYTSGSKISYLKDVADIDFDYEEEKHLTRINGKRCVLITASQKSNENIFNVGDEISPVLESFRKELPVDIKLVKNFDQSVSVKNRLTRFAKDFLIAIVLVLITLLPLGWRASTVVMISIPLSIAMGLAALDYTGFTINQLSIVGLIVALGILVDDSIVVVENIERYLREGYGKKEAAIKATKQITFAVIGCTTTLVLAFMPLNFLPEASGDFIRSLPMAVTFTIIASLIVSLTIVPFLSSRILAQHHNPEGNFFLRILKKGISGTYSKWLHVALAHPVITLVVAGLIFGGSLLLLPTVGFSLFPKSEKPMFLINIETPEGANIYETDRVTRYVEDGLRQTPEIEYFTANIGKGNPRIYYNVIQKGESPNFAQIFVQSQEMPVSEKVALIDRLRVKFQKYPNAKIEVKDFEQGPNQEAPIAIRIFGENLDTMRTVAARVESILKQTEGTIYVNNPLANRKTSLKININKDKAGLLGVPIVEVNRTIRLAVAGLNVGQFKDTEGDDYTIVATVPKGKFADLDVFKNLYVNSAVGTAIPLKQIADIQLETSTNLIRHYDKDRYVSVTAFLKSGYLTDNVFQQVLQKLDAVQFPEGFSYQAAGELESRQKSFGGLGTIVLITAFGFLGVLILEFGTFKSSIIVLSVIPLGIVGAILMLLATGYPMSFVAVIGLIALVGIEVKNSILLVDFTNQLREEGMPLLQAIEHAGEIRFVPIVLTSLTAIGGLIPLAIEGNPLYSPLALVLIGGLISSTLLSRIVTPVMYKLLPPRVEVKAQPEPVLVLGE